MVPVAVVAALPQDDRIDRPSMSLGAVIHVTCLEEAISLYAAARVAGKALPTFTTTIEEWPTFLEDASNSFTIEHEVGLKKYRWQGVMLCVTAIGHRPASTHPAPALLQ